MNFLKSFALLITVPITLTVCFYVGLTSIKVNRSPAIEKAKTYHFNKSLLVQVAELRK